MHNQHIAEEREKTDRWIKIACLEQERKNRKFIPSSLWHEKYGRLQNEEKKERERKRQKSVFRSKGALEDYNGQLEKFKYCTHRILPEKSPVGKEWI